MTSVQKDWSFSDRFLPSIRKIVGPRLLETASLEVDRNHATDLVVMRAKNLMIACRVRRPNFGAAFVNQFTVRSNRGSGMKTELDKIIEGYGDWMLYGFAEDDHSEALAHWSLIDLHAFRAHLIKSPDVLKTGEHTLAEGTSFRWFDLRSFPNSPSILIASSAGR